jgi:hypothetical protein
MKRIKPSEQIINTKWLHEKLWNDYRLPKKKRDEMIPLFFDYWRAKGLI